MSVRTVVEAARGSLDIVRRGWALLAIALLADAAFLFIFLVALQTYLPESLRTSDAIAGWALASFGLAKLLTQLGSGFVTDRIGARRAIVLGAALLLIADTSMLPLAHVAPWLIVGAAAIEGLGSSVIWPAVYAAGDARFDAGEKGRFTAMLTLATGAAIAVGLGGGTALNAYVSFDVAMAAPIAGLLVAFVLALALRMEHADLRGHEPMPRPGEFRAILSHPQRAAFAVVVFANAAAIGALTASFRAYGRDVLGVSLAREAMYLLPAAVLGGLLVVPGGAIADRIGARRVMAPGFGLAGVCFILLARWSDPGFVVATGALAGASFGLAVPAIASTMMSLAGATGRRGGVIGWFMTMDGIGHSVGPASAGLLLALFGAPSVLVLTGALFITVAYIAMSSRMGEGAPAEIRVEGGRPEPATGGQ